MLKEYCDVVCKTVINSVEIRIFLLNTKTIESAITVIKIAKVEEIIPIANVSL